MFSKTYTLFLKKNKQYRHVVKKANSLQKLMEMTVTCPSHSSSLILMLTCSSAPVILLLVPSGGCLFFLDYRLKECFMDEPV